MNKFQRLTASVVLVFVLTLPALAGEMDMGKPAPPPPPGGETGNYARKDVTKSNDEITTLLLGIAISVWQKLP